MRWINQNNMIELAGDIGLRWMNQNNMIELAVDVSDEMLESKQDMWHAFWGSELDKECHMVNGHIVTNDKEWHMANGHIVTNDIENCHVICDKMIEWHMAKSAGGDDIWLSHLASNRAVLALSQREVTRKLTNAIMRPNNNTTRCSEPKTMVADHPTNQRVSCGAKVAAAKVVLL